MIALVLVSFVLFVVLGGLNKVASFITNLFSAVLGTMAFGCYAMLGLLLIAFLMLLALLIPGLAQLLGLGFLMVALGVGLGSIFR